MADPSSWLPSLIGPVVLQNNGTPLAPRTIINFRTNIVASDDGAEINVDATGITGVSVVGETITNTLDAKLKPATMLANLTTVSAALVTLLTMAMGTATGVANLVARVNVTDASGANVGTFMVDADFKLVTGVPTLIYPASLAAAVTSRGKAGAIAGTEVTLVISGTSVIVKVTPPSSTAYTWTIHALAQISLP